MNALKERLKPIDLQQIFSRTEKIPRQSLKDFYQQFDPQLKERVPVAVPPGLWILRILCAKQHRDQKTRVPVATSHGVRHQHAKARKTAGRPGRRQRFLLFLPGKWINHSVSQYLLAVPCVIKNPLSLCTTAKMPIGAGGLPAAK